jgi:CheY-like chemotaxis protein
MIITQIPQPINRQVYTGTTDPLSLHNKKILIAEDDDDDFYLITTAILSICKTVEILRTNDGIMLCSLLQASYKFDVIILDINMPYKTGILCLDEIRRKPELALTKVIMNSTSSWVKDIDRCYELGADFYLQKPGTFAAFVRLFDTLFATTYFQQNQKTPKHDFVIKDSICRN